jgi:4-amino-4-deoxy-L-arabinose transferase-like glycosyltransferase
LYYLLAAGIEKLAGRLGSRGEIVALRAISIVLGAGLLVVIYAAGRTLAPARPELAPLAAGLAAFLPMQTAMSAAINNDTLANLLASASLLVALRGLRDGFDRRAALLLGGLGGALLLTKFTVYLFLPLTLAALAAGASVPAVPGEPRCWRRAAGLVGLALAISALLSGWWFVRNVGVYGWPDLFGLLQHDRVVVGQPRWPGLGEQLESIRFFLYSLFRSFWAQFGWMAVVLDGRYYGLFLLSLMLAGAGLYQFWRRERSRWPLAGRQGLWLLVAALGLVLLEVVVYNLSFIQAQGRYLFPAILPFALLTALGWSSLARLEPGTSNGRWLGFALGYYLVWALGLESVWWLVVQGPAPLLLQALPIVPLWLARRVEIRRPPAQLAATAAGALLGVLVLANAAALLRFVAPYFAGW